MTSPSRPAPARLQGRRVLVVGGRGFIGSHVVRALVKAGASVHLFGPAMEEDRLGELARRVGEALGSLTDEAAVSRAFSEADPTDAVSCAGYGSGRLGMMRSSEAESEVAMAVNVLGHRGLLDRARRQGVGRVVWTSSTVVYGPGALYGPDRVDEAAPRAPETFYGLTKSLAEDVSGFYARRYGLSVAALRPPLILGPGLWYEGAAVALAELFRAARRKSPYRLKFHDEPIDLMHVADVADAVVATLASEVPLSGAFNLEGVTARASELVSEVRGAVPGVDVTFSRADRPAMLLPLVSGERLRAATGFAAKRDRAGFVRTMLRDEVDP